MKVAVISSIASTSHVGVTFEMADRRPNLELSAVDLLFAAVVTGAPPEEYEEQLETLRSDLEGGGQDAQRETMVLHVAVRAGRVAWVERLLCVGVDASTTKDGGGLTAVQVAQGMRDKHPGNEDVGAVLSMVRVAVARDAAAARKAKKEREEEVDGCAARTTPRGVRTNPRPRGCHVASDSSLLSLEMVDPRDIEGEFRSERTSVARNLAALKQSVDEMRLRIDSWDLSTREAIADTRYKQRSLGMTVEALKESTVALDNDMASIKESVNELRTQPCSPESIQQELESTIRCMFKMTDSVNELTEKVQQGGEELKEMSEAILRKVDPDKERKFRRKCVDDMMKKTTIINSDSVKRSYVRRLYDNLYSVDEMTSSLLKFIRNESDVEIHIDCDSSTIENLKEFYTDEDGEHQIGFLRHAFGDLETNRIYLGALQELSHTEENVIGCLAFHMAKIAVQKFYQNQGAPYADGQLEEKQEYKEIVDEIVKRKDGLPGNAFLSEAAEMKTEIGRHVKHVAAVPGDIALFVFKGGRTFLEKHAPNLLSFYEEHVYERILQPSAIRSTDAL